MPSASAPSIRREIRGKSVPFELPTTPFWSAFTSPPTGTVVWVEATANPSQGSAQLGSSLVAGSPVGGVDAGASLKTGALVAPRERRLPFRVGRGGVQRGRFRRSGGWHGSGVGDLWLFVAR